ncbi:MAG: ATP-binding protein [Pyrinomonadaceae bacterium]
MKRSNATVIQIVLIAGAIILTTAVHLLTPVDRIVLHEIYQRLYYVPIIAAAFLFGLRGGLAAALFASVAYLPHILFQWHHIHYDYAINQYAEIVLFNVVSGIMGLLGDRNRKSRERAERTAAELQKAYTELRQTFEQLLQSDRLTSLGELSAAVVHEVRNPLGAIKGAVEILEDGLAPDNPRREFAAIAKLEVDRLNRLVGEFLLFARPTSPAVALADINEIVSAVATLIEQRATTQNVSIERQFAFDLSPVMVDAEQIKQVLLNLFLNALQVMPEGGRLTLRTMKCDQGLIGVEVEDEGGGVNPSIVARIFDPFFTTKEKGVGLGLSIAYKISLQNHGTLSVRNEKGGAVFQLIIPTANESANSKDESRHL